MLWSSALVTYRTDMDSTDKEEHLRKTQERERDWHASDTVEQREERLRLQQLRMNQWERLAAKPADERQARLQ